MKVLDLLETIEEDLDMIAKHRKIGKPDSIPLLDDYYKYLLHYFKSINNLEDNDHINFSALIIKPFNIEERINYIEVRKYHYMGYQQMKSLKSELIKMHAAYKAKNNR
ncbi:YpoC family protein [Staphylococcus canis]|uniref:YpoC-like domain-containing protein n=1 Tax=Staphylococcus canis TaxID=2724942 RepID=A0ABS0TCA8_9STAP|nr:hypothetical protein [Staphylococcus canis]MBI5975373.1 hypothetical protein [Staphylococcus canis]